MAEPRRVPFISLPTDDAVVILDEEEKRETNNNNPPATDRQREAVVTSPPPQPRREAGDQRPSQHEGPQREAGVQHEKELQHEPPLQKREPETRHCPAQRVLSLTSEQPCDPEEQRPLQREVDSRHNEQPARAALLQRDPPEIRQSQPLLKVPSVTSEPRLEQETRHFAQQGEAAAVEPAGGPPPKKRRTVRLELALKDPTEEGCAEYNYPELLGGSRQRGRAAGPAATHQQKKPPLSDDPFNDDERERQQVETLAKKFEAKYGGKVHKHRKDRMQDLIDIGYGYDETDPFIDNSEAYDELVPASLTTKHGGFYINTGTLQFRQTSDSEDDDFVGNKKPRPPKVLKLQDGEDCTVKKRKRKEDGSDKEKKPRKLKVTNQLGVMSLNSHKPEKKKKKHKDPLALAAMIRKFEMEKDAMKELTQDPPLLTVVNATTKTPMVARNELSDLSLGCDPVLSIFGSTSERELLQEAENALELLTEFELDQLLEAASLSDAGEENGILSHSVSHDLSPKPIPELPEGLPAQLEKRIEDLRAAAKLFDEEGRKKFFTQDMNNILLDIELQLQDLSTSSRNEVYSHIEAFVPCNKDSLIKRLKKLHLNVQDDRLREPLQRLKIAVSNIMPLQISSFQEHCLAHNQAKSAKVQAGEVEKNGSEEDDDEKPGKRVTGPRKKFLWDEPLRGLLCNLVKIKLGCYELEPNQSQSAEDYLKNFMDTELKPLWPKGWMQARMLLKESRTVHNHLTSAIAKKKVIIAPKPKTKDSSPKKEQKTSTPLVTSTRVSAPIPVTPISIHSSSNCITASETICLDDSLDDDLPFNPPSLDSVTDALSVLNNGTKTAAVSSSLDTPTSRPRSSLREDKLATIMSKLPLGAPKKVEPAQAPHSSSLIAGHSGSIPKKPDELAAHATIASGLIAGSSVQNPKVSIEPLPAKLLQQGLQRSVQAQVSSSTSAQAHVSSSTPSVSQTQVTTSLSSTCSSQPQVSSSQPEGSSLATSHQHTMGQQNYVSPLQVTVSKSQANPVVRLTNSPHLCSSMTKTPEKHRHTSSSLAPGHSPQGSQTLVSRTSSSSTSTNYLTKAMGNLSSTMGFKSPYTMASSCKTTTSPSSSSPSILVAQSTSHQKQSGNSIINQQSPAINILSSNQSTAFHPVKVPQTSSKITSPAASKVANQTAPKMANLAAPKVINPPVLKVASPAPPKSFNLAAPKVSNPAAPKVSNPAAPKVSNPAAPKVSNPAAPKVSNPAAPKVSNPAAPKVSNPAAPKVSNPAAPKVSNPATPKMPNSVAPKMPNPVASKMPSPVAPKMASPPPKLPSPPPKMTSPAPRLPSPAPRLPSPAPRVPSTAAKLPNQAPKMPSPSPKPLNPVSKPPSPAPNPPSPAPKSTSPAPKLNTSSPGTICRNNVSRANLNVPIRSNLNSSSGANRTNLPSGAVIGTQGATKLLNQHRPSSSSGSPVTAAIVQPTTGSSLLATNSPLTLMTSPLSVTSPNVASSPLAPFSMLSGLVPVTVPFQFPLGLLGFGSDAVTTSSGTTSAVFHHSLTQNLLKGLQTSTQHAATLSHTALPSHLQQVFTDGGQSKGDAKLQRKTQ